MEEAGVGMEEIGRKIEWKRNKTMNDDKKMSS